MLIKFSAQTAKHLVTSGVVALTFASFPGSSLALVTTSRNVNYQNTQVVVTGTEVNGTELSGTPGVRGENGRARMCQAHEAVVKNRLTHITDLVTNMETKFDAIATRVETYYTSKAVPSGKTVLNYDTLVAAIQTNKTAVQTAVATLQTDATGFSCTIADPKGGLTKIRTDMQGVKTALKTYRTSIRNLIVAVHSVTGAMNRPAGLSGSPKPTHAETEDTTVTPTP